MYRSFTQPNIFGLSIQPQSIQLVEFANSHEKKEVQCQSILSFNDHPFFDNNLFEKERLAAAIKTIINIAKPSTNKVVVHIPHYLVKEDSITVPANLKNVEIEREIETRIKATYPISKEAIHFDYIREQDLRKRQERIHFVLARKNYLDQLLQIVQTAGLTVKIIDTENHALIRTWRYLHAEKSIIHSLNGLLSLSPKRALLLLFKDNQLILTEETEWNDDVKQLKQFLMLISSARMQATFNLLLTGNVACIKEVLDNTQEDSLNFHTTSLFEKPSTSEQSSLQQCELFIAFGLALRKFHYA